jgi:hypothetical protein
LENILIEGSVDAETAKLSMDRASAIAAKLQVPVLYVNSAALQVRADLFSILTNLSADQCVILYNLQALPGPFADDLSDVLSTGKMKIPINSGKDIFLTVEPFSLIGICSAREYCHYRVLTHFTLWMDTEIGDVEEFGGALNLNMLTYDWALDLLGLASSPNLSEIKGAYRKTIGQWHPDRLEGMAEELKLLANERMKLINAAYYLLKQTTGVKT